MDPRSPRRLVFVYNEDGTPGALLMGLVHRLVAPETYPCRLCDLTYGRLVKKKEWRDFVGRLPLPSRFHLRSTFLRRFPSQADGRFPAVLVEASDGTLVELVSAAEIDAVRNLDELKELVTAKVRTLGGT